MPAMSSFADLTLSETEPRGTRSELMAEFADADSAYRNLNAQWHRAFHDPTIT
jgi:hypothetical protein